ncbi:uncharacterized protein [Dermacentor albipictus]
MKKKCVKKQVKPKAKKPAEGSKILISTAVAEPLASAIPSTVIKPSEAASFTEECASKAADKTPKPTQEKPPTEGARDQSHTTQSHPSATIVAHAGPGGDTGNMSRNTTVPHALDKRDWGCKCACRVVRTRRRRRTRSKHRPFTSRLRPRPLSARDFRGRRHRSPGHRERGALTFGYSREARARLSLSDDRCHSHTMGEAAKHKSKVKGTRKKHQRHNPPKQTRFKRAKRDGNIDMVEIDKEGLEAEEAEGLPKPVPSKSTYDPTTGLVVTKHEPTSIRELRRKSMSKLAAKHKKTKEGGKAPRRASRGQGPPGVSLAAKSSACSSRKAVSLVKDGTAYENCHGKLEPSEELPEQRVTVQSRHTHTESDRDKSEDPAGLKYNPSAATNSTAAGRSNLASIRSALSNTGRRVYVAVGLAVLLLAGVVVLLVVLLSHKRAKIAAMLPSTKPSTRPK